MTFRWLLPPALLLLACVSACDQNDVAAPFEVDSGALTLYGYLDASRNVQRARIEPRRQSVDYPRTPEDAFLADTEVLSYPIREDGVPPDTVRWTQRAERLPDGTYAAIFSASFRPIALARYRVVTRRAAGPEGPALESAEEVTVPAACAPVMDDWRREGDRVVVPVRWPAELRARLDTVEVSHVGTIINPDLVLEVPDTSFRFVDSLVIGMDTVAVFQGLDSVYTPSGSYPVIEDAVVVGQDTFSAVVAMGDTLPLMFEPDTLLSFTRPVPPDSFYRLGFGEIVQGEEGPFLEVDLQALERALTIPLSDTHRVLYKRLQLAFRVRDIGWDGEGGDPTDPEAGFLGGANGGRTFLTPPRAAVEETGMTPVYAEGGDCN